MKKLKIVFLYILFFTFLIKLQATELPEEFWNSQLMIREGINDLNNTSVADLFKNKKFVVNTTLEGKAATVKYGKIELTGNSVKMEFDITLENVVTGKFIFYFNFKNNYTLLEKIIIENLRVGEENTTVLETFNDISIGIITYKQLLAE